MESGQRFLAEILCKVVGALLRLLGRCFAFLALYKGGRCVGLCGCFAACLALKGSKTKVLKENGGLLEGSCV